jgi:hypothetical protein
VITSGVGRIWRKLPRHSQAERHVAASFPLAATTERRRTLLLHDNSPPSELYSTNTSRPPLSPEPARFCIDQRLVSRRLPHNLAGLLAGQPVLMNDVIDDGLGRMLDRLVLAHLLLRCPILAVAPLNVLPGDLPNTVGEPVGHCSLFS